MSAWNDFQAKINSEHIKVTPLEWALWNGRNQSSDECLEQAATELARLTAAEQVLRKMVDEESCDNDGRGCICVMNAQEYFDNLALGKVAK